MLSFFLGRYNAEIEQERLFSVGAALGVFNLRYVEQNAPAMTFECRETYYFQILVDFGAVIDKLQRFAVKRRARSFL